MFSKENSGQSTPNCEILNSKTCVNLFDSRNITIASYNRRFYAGEYKDWLRNRGLCDVKSAVKDDELEMEHLLEMTNEELEQWTTQHEFTAEVKDKLELALTKFKEELLSETVRVYYTCI